MTCSLHPRAPESELSPAHEFARDVDKLTLDGPAPLRAATQSRDREGAVTRILNHSRYREDMPAPHRTFRSRAREWSRTAFAMAAVFGSLPLAGKLFLGSWDFDGAAGIGCLCLIAGEYFHIVSRRFPVAPDPATILERAGQEASEGRSDQAIAVLTEAIRLSPQLWQAFQYRGELYLRQGDSDAALEDFSKAIRLAPQEPHLYLLRGHVYSLLGDEASAQSEGARAAALAGDLQLSSQDRPATSDQ